MIVTIRPSELNINRNLPLVMQITLAYLQIIKKFNIDNLDMAMCIVEDDTEYTYDTETVKGYLQ